MEFGLKSGRRADVIGLDGGARFVIIEVKASAADFSRDRKWPEYLSFCDGFYFAVGDSFPLDLLPGGCGVIVADAYHGTVIEPAPTRPMNGSRRKAQVLSFALTAADRLRDRLDPHSLAGTRGGAR